MLISRKVMHNGGLVPRWYGISYWKVYTDELVCYPFPLNHLVAWARMIWFASRDAKISWRDKYFDLLKCYDEGLKSKWSQTDGEGPARTGY